MSFIFDFRKMADNKINSKKTSTALACEVSFALDAKGIKLMILGLVVLFSGFLLLAGGGVKDPQVFNYDMFNFQRLVAAPIVMLCGIIIEIVAIMGKRREE